MPEGKHLPSNEKPHTAHVAFLQPIAIRNLHILSKFTTQMAIGTTIRGLVAVLGLSAIFTSANAAACRGLSGKDKITAVALSPGLSLTRGYQEGLVTWEFSTDVCLYRWLIEMSPLDGGSSNKVSFYEKSEARSASIPINEIKPGVLYRVSITMEFAPDRYGPKESIDTVPITQCSVSGVPGVPVGLYVKDQTSQGYNVAEDYIEVCWASYSDGNAGCPDEYTVALRVQPSGPSGLFEDRHAWRFEKFPTAGCHRVYGIEQGTMYDIGIRAFNVASTSSSDVALIQDYVVRFEDGYG